MAYKTWQGGTYGGGSIVFTRAVSFGGKVGATPDGRYYRKDGTRFIVLSTKPIPIDYLILKLL